MAFRRGRARAREQAFFSEKRNRRYKVLNDHVFRPLSGPILRVDGLRLLYNASNILNSAHYIEAKEHIKKDLPLEIIKPENIREMVDSYTAQFHSLSDDLIPTRIKDVFKDVVTISENPGQLIENSILLPFMVKMLRRYWFDDVELTLDYKNGHLKTEEHEVVATIPPESETTIRGLVEGLKKDGKINSVLNGNIITDGLRFRRNEIINNATDLGKYIKDNIVSKIDSEDYSTVCDKCPKNDD